MERNRQEVPATSRAKIMMATRQRAGKTVTRAGAASSSLGREIGPPLGKNKASWFDSAACRTMNIDHSPGLIHLYGDRCALLDPLGFCFQVRQWEYLFAFRSRQFDLLLHFAEMNQLPRHILMLAFLAFGMDIDDGIIFVQNKRDLVALLKGPMSVTLSLVCI